MTGRRARGALWAAALAADPGDVLDAVLDAALDGLTDLLASSLAGRHHPDVARLRATLPSTGGDGQTGGPGVAVPGQPGRYAPSDAALLGGFQAHVLDFDDAHATVRGHPTAVLVPALLAQADDATPGPEFLAAYVVGVEVLARLGTLAGHAHHAAGWHPTGTLGGIAAAVAGARLAGLDPAATDSAASLAASMAGGTRAQFGSAAKPLHAGLAAAAGVRAVTWARAGLTGGAGALFGPEGLARAMSFDVTDPVAAAEVLDAGWRERWAIRDPGLWVKRYPFCSAGMAVHEAAETVGAQLTGTGRALREGDISAVRAVVRPGADAALHHRVPATGTEGRFSLEYLVALGVLGRTPVDARFVDLDPDGVALAERVVRAYDGQATRAPWARVEVTRADGTTAAAEVTEPLGAPGRPLTPAQRRAKLAEAVGGTAATRIGTAVRALPGGTVGHLRRALAAIEEETQ